MKDIKTHWETIYQTKNITDVCWYQSKPITSLNFISELDLKKVPKNAVAWRSGNIPLPKLAI